MTALVRWEPFRDIISLRDAMDRLFEDSFVRLSRFWPGIGEWQPPIDMYQTDNEVVVKAAIPGLKPEEVDISITGDTVTIKGEHKEDKEVRDEDYLYKECRFGSFSRTVTIPVKVKTDKAEAVFENGILTLTLPKAEEVKPRQIKVKVKAEKEAKN